MWRNRQTTQIIPTPCPSLRQHRGTLASLLPSRNPSLVRIWISDEMSSTSFLCWSITLETWLGGSIVRSYGACRSFGLFFRRAMYTVTDESRKMDFLALYESHHPLADSFRPSRVVGASTRIAQWELLLFGGDRRWARRGFVSRLRISPLCCGCMVCVGVGVRAMVGACRHFLYFTFWLL